MSKIWAWACLFIGLSLGAASSLVGMAPNVVEQAGGRGDPINCGPTLFHNGARPSPLCDSTTDPWRLVSELGLFVAAVLIIAAFVLFLHTATTDHATGSRT